MAPGGRRVLVSGATGLIGSALVPRLERAGWQVTRLTRKARGDGRAELVWNPDAPWAGLTPPQLSGFEAVIHLAGENIAGGRWTAARKHAIRESRIATTSALAALIAAASPAPRTFVCASAVGWYADRGDAPQDESAPPAPTFLGDVCRAWEAAAEPAAAAGVRTAHLRIGVVLSRRGGALAAMLPAFQLGLGGPLGNGQQYMSWIALEDLAAALAFVLERETLRGPINATAPQPVRQREFARTLGRVLGRPAVLPTPGFILRLAVGEMADALLLTSLRVVPEQLQQAGFTFAYPELEGALRRALDRPAKA